MRRGLHTLRLAILSTRGVVYTGTSTTLVTRVGVAGTKVNPNDSRLAQSNDDMEIYTRVDRVGELAKAEYANELVVRKNEGERGGSKWFETRRPTLPRMGRREKREGARLKGRGGEELGGRRGGNLSWLLAINL
eukprot:TRINITY_DN21953_c0_g1_i1.p2 TRINITY_DN21953_c0_g1~~TRINITY_DN21953_c0_g1_i1.p2  ORF type:complete len:134 (+),score=11.95 TRINITY_DN21953_c0_g1_i1:238-639(+)